MKKELFHENRKKLLFAAAALLALLLLSLCAAGLIKVCTDRNDGQVAAALARISYTEDAAALELSSLQPYTAYDPLSVAQRGQLYRAMAELSYMTGDDREYNHYIACALSYLRRAGDTDAVTYLLNKYIGRLYANGCYASAEELLGEMARSNDVSALSPDMQASYYLSAADVAQMQGKDAAPTLSSAHTEIELLPPGGTKLLNQAKYDLLCARNDIQNGDFERAEARMAGYTPDDHFGLGEKQVYVICDFQIPYYEIMAKLQLHSGQTELAYENVERYLKLCDDFQFRAMKLHLLQYVVNNMPDDTPDGLGRYRELERIVTAQNLSELTGEYGQFLLGDIAQTQADLAVAEREQASAKRNLVLAVVLLYGAIVLYCAISIFVDYMNKDALTRLNSRKQYEKIRRLCEKKKIPHGFLMMDIDDFKNVNDTYGHDEGDEVLRKISEILRRYTGRGISAYRYGGEELCLFFLRVPEERVREIAEEIHGEIRQTVSAGGEPITVSGGIGISQSGENVFRQADRQLYEAKKNGKNQVR